MIEKIHCKFVKRLPSSTKCMVIYFNRATLIPYSNSSSQINSYVNLHYKVFSIILKMSLIMLVAIETIYLYLVLSAIMGREVFISMDQFCGTTVAEAASLSSFKKLYFQ